MKEREGEEERERGRGSKKQSNDSSFHVQHSFYYQIILNEFEQQLSLVNFSFLFCWHEKKVQLVWNELS